MTSVEQAFLEIIQISVGVRDCMSRTLSGDEWLQLYRLANKQSLAGVCFAGIQKFTEVSPETYETLVSHWGIPETVYLEWMGVAATIQLKCQQHEAVIAKLSRSYDQEGIGMMLLKGYGLSRYYPAPELRNSSDIDVYLFDKNGSENAVWKRGDEAMERRFQVAVSKDSEHHTKFRLDGIMVENHYDFVNTRIRRSSKELETTFKLLAKDHANCMEVGGQKVYLPSDKLNALFLLRHSAVHFASEGITMRIVLDWGLFVCGTQALDWAWLWKMAEDQNMHRFLMCLNLICVENLGLDSSRFEVRHQDERLKSRVLEEIMHGIDLVPDASAWQRTVRWWKHRWKHRICYSDSMLSSFLYSVKANLQGVSVK